MASMYDVPKKLVEIFKADERLADVRVINHGDFPDIREYPAITVELKSCERVAMSVGSTWLTQKNQVAVYVRLLDYDKDSDYHGKLLEKVEAVIRDNPTVEGYAIQMPPLSTAARIDVVARAARPDVPMLAAFLTLTARKKEAV